MLCNGWEIMYLILDLLNFTFLRNTKPLLIINKTIKFGVNEIEFKPELKFLRNGKYYSEYWFRLQLKIYSLFFQNQTIQRKSATT